MTTRRLLPIVLCLLAMFGYQRASGQRSPDDRLRQGTAVVPLQPLVFLPADSLRLRGFTPPLPVFVFDSTYRRQPLLRMKDELPGLTRLTSPIHPDPLAGNGTTILGQASLGSFMTTDVGLRAGVSRPHFDATARFGYTHSLGHVTDADHTDMSFAATGMAWLPNDIAPLLARSLVSGAVVLQTSDYMQYGNRLQRHLPDVTARRNATEAAVSVGLDSRRNNTADYQVRLDVNHLLLNDDLIALPSRITFGQVRMTETWYGLVGSTTAWLFDQLLDIDARLQFGSRWMADETKSNPMFMRIQAAGRYDIQEQFHLDYALGMYLYRGTNEKQNFRVTPTFSLTYQYTDGLAFFAEAGSRVERVTHADLLLRNPYLMAGAEYTHIDIPIEVRIGSVLDMRPGLAGEVSAFYRLASHLPYFTQLAPPLERQWIVASEGITSITGVRAMGSVQDDDVGRITGTVTLQTAYNDVREAAPTYFPALTMDIDWTRDLPLGFVAEAHVQYLSARPAGRDDLPGVMLMDVAVEYRLNTPFTLRFAVTNVFDAEWQEWRGYDALPAMAALGLRFRF